MTVRTATLFLLAAAALPALAEERAIDFHRPVKADVKVVIDNLAGVVEVKTWDKNEVSLTGTLGESVKELETTGDEATVKIHVRHPKVVHNPDPSELYLVVPAGAELEIDTVSADVRVRGVRGPVKVDSVSGDVTLAVDSARVNAGTVSGDVNVDAGSAQDLRVSSVSGDVNVRGARGELRGETVSGDLRLSGRSVKRLDAETVSGDLLLDLELAPDAEVKAESLSGDVILTIPALPDGDVELETFSGDVRSAWPAPGADAHEYRREGKGRGRIQLNTFSGDIAIQKK